MNELRSRQLTPLLSDESQLWTLLYALALLGGISLARGFFAVSAELGEFVRGCGTAVALLTPLLWVLFEGVVEPRRKRVRDETASLLLRMNVKSIGPMTTLVVALMAAIGGLVGDNGTFDLFATVLKTISMMALGIALMWDIHVGRCLRTLPTPLSQVLS